MRTIKIWNDNPSESQISDIVNVIDNGGIVLYPTDTVYALGCDALNVKAVETICRIKGLNPAKNHLSIVCDDISRASEYARIDDTGFRLMRDYTPGAVTFLFRALNTLPKAFRGRKTVGVRIPGNAVARAIVARMSRPLLTASVEHDDEDIMRNPELLAEQYEGEASLLVDGGDGGTEVSTIVNCTGMHPEITRVGKMDVDL